MYISFLIISNGGNIMGLQTRYFATQEDMVELFKYIYSQGGIAINEDGTELTEYDIAHILDSVYMNNRFKFCSLYIKMSDSNIIYNYYPNIDRKCLNFLKSDVLQFDVPESKLDQEKMQKEYHEGRFYFFGEQYGNSPKTKSLYSSIKKYIIKNFISEKCKRGALNSYMGKNAFEQYKKGKYIVSYNRVFE